MARAKVIPTDQTAFANKPGGISPDTMLSSPATGIKANIVVSVTFELNTVTGTASVAYAIDGGADVVIHTETDQGATGVQTKTATIASGDLSTLVVKARAVSPVDPSSCTINSWFITYPKAGVIAEL